jgi:apolipoprotein N-acyltransferase
MLWIIPLSAITALLYIISFPPWNYSECAFFVFVPWLVFMALRIPKRIALGSFLTGFLAWLGILWWLTHVTFAGWIGLSAVLGLFFGGWLWLSAKTMQKLLHCDFMERMMGLLGLASFWILLEYVRGVLFTGFPWLPLIASQWRKPLMLGFLPYGGSAMGSFTLVLLNLCLAMYIIRLIGPVLKQEGHRVSEKPMALKLGSFAVCPEFYCAIILIIAQCVVGFWHYRQYSSLPMQPFGKIGFVQPCTPPTLKWDPKEALTQLRVLTDFTEAAAKAGASVVIWPEAATPLPALGPGSLQGWVENLSNETHIPIVMGNTAYLDNKWYNGLFVVNPQTGVELEFYAKRRRVPFGEYIPFRKYLPKAFLPYIQTVVPLPIDTTPGSENVIMPVLSLHGQSWRLGGLVCYEDIFASLARDLTAQGADLLVVVTNDAWGHEDGMSDQHGALSVLRAAECGRCVWRCGNSGWSGWIDPLGRILFEMKDHDGRLHCQGVQFYDASIATARPMTHYVKKGDWFVLMCLAIGLWSFGRLVRRLSKIFP